MLYKTTNGFLEGNLTNSVYVEKLLNFISQMETLLLPILYSNLEFQIQFAQNTILKHKRWFNQCQTWTEATKSAATTETASFSSATT